MQQKLSAGANQSRTEATRTSLLDAARRMFAQKGYAAASTPEIVAASGVTRGALYHHFADKEALFRAVVVAEYEAVAAEVAETPADQDALSALMAGSRRYLEAMRRDGRVRIMLVDGPAVLGPGDMARIDRTTTAATLAAGLAAAMEGGRIRALPVEALTGLLSAMFDKAALAISMGASEDETVGVIDVLLQSLTTQAD